jgi:hypothetical protein
VPELQLPRPRPPMANPMTMPKPQADTNKVVVNKFNSLLSAINLVPKSLAHTNLHLVVSSNCKNTAKTKCTLATRRHRTALLTTCITNVITPYCPSSETMLTEETDNGNGAPKYEH